MEKPKPEDFDLSEEKLKFCEDFEKMIEKREKLLEKKIGFLSFLIIFLLIWIELNFEKVTFGGTIGALFFSFCFILYIWSFSLSLAEFVNKIFIKYHKNYNLYQEIKKSKKKLREEEERYDEYLMRLKEENKKNEARKIIDNNLKHLPNLKQKIFNQQIKNNNYSDFLSFKKAVDDLSWCSHYMSF